MLTRLETHLNESVAKLEENEIKAALDTARYQILSYQEIDRLLIDEEKRNIYLEKLSIDLEVAFANEERAWEVSRASDEEVRGAKADLAEKRHFWEQESERRTGEIETLDFIIDIFLTQISTMGEALRARIDDYVHDDRFDQGIFGRKTDDHVDTDLGSVHENTVVE